LQTISSAIQWWANTLPDQIALSIGADRVSYRAMRDASERIAAHLIELGVERGDRVGVCGANSTAYCLLIFGILRAGAVVSPLGMRNTSNELSELVEDLTPTVVFADAERRTKFDDIGVKLRPLEDVVQFLNGPRAQVLRDPAPDDYVGIIATSGSTAKPKGVVFSNRTMTCYSAAWMMEEAVGARDGRVIIPAPLSTSAGFVNLVHYTTLGFTCYFEPVFDAQVFLDILENERVTCFAAAPLFFERMAALPSFANADLSNLRVATTGGAPVSRVLQDKWATKGVVLRQIYGQTEAGGNSTIMPADLAMKFPDKCGRGGIFTEHAIVDEKGQRVPPGTVGQIVVRGAGVMVGYWNNPAATAETLRDGWLYTGDLGVLDEDGLLTFVDRMKDIIISGGLNISAAEVERAVASFPGVEEVVVIAAKDEKFGETPLAVVHANREIDVAALIKHCNGLLADYKVPRYVALEPDPMPRTATGKLFKPPMRKKYENAAQVLPRVR
jgi:fatty-acyl-CoA synthase